MSDQRLPPLLPHRDDCNCICHLRAMYVDDGECGDPPDGGPRCCYGYPGSTKDPKRVPCGGCGTTEHRLTEVEGLPLCRACRRVLR